MHVKASASGAELFEPVHLDGQSLQDLADSVVAAAKLRLEGTRSCCILESSSIKMDESSDFEIPLFMTEVAFAESISVRIFAAVIASHSDAENKTSAWVFLGDRVQLHTVSTLLSRKGVIRSDLSSIFCTSTEVGHGSFAKVVVGQLASLGHQTAAAKQMDVKNKKADVLREVNAMVAAQGCPNIIGYLGTFYDPHANGWTILMEFVESGDLYTLMQQKGRALEESNARLLSYGLLNALAHLQSLEVPIVHRDVKIENILVDHTYHAKLCDFGLACLINDEEEMKRRCGSIGCLAPEILKMPRQDTITVKIDAFSAGVVIAYILTGRHPFKGSTPESMLKKNVRCKIDYSTKLWKRVSDDASEVADMLVQRKPRNRASVVEALDTPWFHAVSKPLKSSASVVSTCSGQSTGDFEGSGQEWMSSGWTSPCDSFCNLPHSVTPGRLGTPNAEVEGRLSFQSSCASNGNFSTELASPFSPLLSFRGKEGEEGVLQTCESATPEMEVQRRISPASCCSATDSMPASRISVHRALNAKDIGKSFDNESFASEGTNSMVAEAVKRNPCARSSPLPRIPLSPIGRRMWDQITKVTKRRGSGVRSEAWADVVTNEVSGTKRRPQFCF